VTETQQPVLDADVVDEPDTQPPATDLVRANVSTLAVTPQVKAAELVERLNVIKDAGQVDNPDLPDLWNTVVKMAEKRARVDAVLAVTGASAIFTQDAEDLSSEPEPTQEPDPEPSSPTIDPAWASGLIDKARAAGLTLAELAAVLEGAGALDGARMRAENLKLTKQGAENTIARLSPDQAGKLEAVLDEAIAAKTGAAS
jgi:hypothetical protein